ncbi:MAG: OprO/OprP family phosphate-selective porin, partial [Syntrophales bacterium]|nr:OprO/OprP family phosphate-selective porin [Syntrophales bacterium]
MKVRKGMVGMVLVFCALLWAQVGLLWASEAELIQLLQKKNIISQEEADRMLRKVEETEKKKKEEVTKEIAKGDYLPSALKGVKLSSTIYTFWESKSLQRGNNANTNQFVLDRAYLTLTKDFNAWLSMNFTADLFRSADANEAASGLELRMKYAYANLKFFHTETMIGMVPTPSDAYDGSIWPFRVQGKNYLDALSIQSSADLGIVNRGVFGGFMDEEYFKYGSRSFGGKRGGYMIRLSNGAGYDRQEANNNNV